MHPTKQHLNNFLRGRAGILLVAAGTIGIIETIGDVDVGDEVTSTVGMNTNGC